MSHALLRAVLRFTMLLTMSETTSWMLSTSCCSKCMVGWVPALWRLMLLLLAPTASAVLGVAGAVQEQQPPITAVRGSYGLGACQKHVVVSSVQWA
jgi:hypothetical protein